MLHKLCRDGTNTLVYIDLERLKIIIQDLDINIRVVFFLAIKSYIMNKRYIKLVNINI